MNKISKSMVVLLVVSVGSLMPFSLSAGEKELMTMRDKQAILSQIPAPELSDQEVVGQVRPRSYPMQPPTIPHSIQGFQINTTMNMCLNCHNRKTAPMVKAPAIGVSHYQNRDYDYLADVSPRRYFCNQCHVPQLKREPKVPSVFKEMEQVAKEQ